MLPSISLGEYLYGTHHARMNGRLRGDQANEKVKQVIKLLRLQLCFMQGWIVVKRPKKAFDFVLSQKCTEHGHRKFLTKSVLKLGS